MAARYYERMKQRAYGFTIVELLIVIVVLAILAAISVVAYSGIQERASNSAVQSDLRNMAGKFQSHLITEGALPRGSSTTSVMPGFDKVPVTKNAYSEAAFNLYYCRGVVDGHERFAIAATSKSGQNYKYESSGGLSEFSGWFGGSGIICDSTNVPRSSADFSYSYAYNPSGNVWYSWVN